MSDTTDLLSQVKLPENPVPIDPARVAALIAQQSATLNARTQKSKAIYREAVEHLAGGVPSSYQLRDPWPIYIDSGSGERVTDVDGNEYYDFHNGFGSMLQGHGHPEIGAAIERRHPLGSHFGSPTEDSIWVANELARRWGLPKWRFTNSGSEATMDAIRIARAVTGRDTVMKIFGSYHGHHDQVMVSIGVAYDKIGERDHLASLPYGAGIPQSVVENTIPVHFNDAASMERRIVELDADGRKPACVIMEPAMMNLGVVMPEPGYLAAVREITRRHDIVLIFDEVKTGLTMAPGGATELFGVQPDMVTMAKTLGGGLPTGAIGGTDEVMRVVEDGSVYQVGTYSGNPLAMAAARASLEKVLTADAYTHLRHLNERIVSGCQAVVDTYRLPGYALGTGAKGCVTFSPVKVVDYETFKKHQNVDLCTLAWLWNMNHGIYMTPGREEEWTLSVVHSDAAVDHYVAVFDDLAKAITAG